MMKCAILIFAIFRIHCDNYILNRDEELNFVHRKSRNSFIEGYDKYYLNIGYIKNSMTRLEEIYADKFYCPKTCHNSKYQNVKIKHKDNHHVFECLSEASLCSNGPHCCITFVIKETDTNVASFRYGTKVFSAMTEMDIYSRFYGLNDENVNVPTTNIYFINDIGLDATIAFKFIYPVHVRKICFYKAHALSSILCETKVMSKPSAQELVIIGDFYIKDFVYLGCYDLKNTLIDLQPTKFKSNDSNIHCNLHSVTECYNECFQEKNKSREYTIFTISNQACDCHCGNIMFEKVDMSQECTFSCINQSSLSCGGFDQIAAIYMFNNDYNQDKSKYFNNVLHSSKFPNKLDKKRNINIGGMLDFNSKNYNFIDITKDKMQPIHVILNENVDAKCLYIYFEFDIPVLQYGDITARVQLNIGNKRFTKYTTSKEYSGYNTASYAAVYFDLENYSFKEFSLNFDMQLSRVLFSGTYYFKNINIYHMILFEDVMSDRNLKRNNPCFNYNMDPYCQNQSLCKIHSDSDRKFSCTCRKPFTGKLCNLQYDPCKNLTTIYEKYSHHYMAKIVCNGNIQQCYPNSSSNVAYSCKCLTGKEKMKIISMI
ncbi:hypothetical protein A3Q56_02270 [Intoshia linei]|uniref:EGF-like domain-containing protein n=1 Tax=Intoshia linei TaxID=1819745 RepID=A0A177B6I5_9BILA|nr:hypothetical protein A3Q56_02270 [Intoshia linei]